jgi:hypothetical protein
MRRAAIPCLLLLIACGPHFYQAPPGIGSYPERVAAKRWQHLFAETQPDSPAKPDDKNLCDTLEPMTPAQRTAHIDSLLDENRKGSFSTERANLLHELREISADPALFAAAHDYIRWRVEDVFTPLPSMKENMRNEELEELRLFSKTRGEQRFDFLRQQIDKVDALLRPYLLVRRGALLFSEYGSNLAEEDFNAVIEEFPKHPRAEVAALMKARCDIEMSRRLRSDHRIRDHVILCEEHLEKADLQLEGLVKSHPKGRFAPDALGWRGAIAFDRRQFGSAVRFQLDRLELQPTREITRGVLRECDKIFEDLLESPEIADGEIWLDSKQHFDAAAVARHPVVARLFVQHCIDPAAHISLPMWWEDSYSGGRATIDFLKRRIFIPKPFVKLALAELGREMMKAQALPDATTLTLLAWSATEDGEHEQALAILQQIPAGHPTDEALLAKGVILQRLDRHPEALLAFDQLAANFPRSPLLADQPFRKSVSLQKTGQFGKAILEIQTLAFPEIPEQAKEETPRLHPRQQLVQWFDTLIQFAPLEELEAAFAGISDMASARELIGSAIRARALAAGRFDLAEQYLSDDAEAPASGWDWPHERLASSLRMTRTEWDQRVAPLALLHEELAAALDSSEKAKLHLAIARHWMEQRGLLTLPSLTISYYAASEEEKQELLRRRNAIALGFGREDIDRELDHRDEATNALEHALEAAKSADSAIAAPALELANQCLFRRAEYSLYQKSRATETRASELSADIHRQLRGRFPQTQEAERAVFLTFTPPGGAWMPGDYNQHHSAEALVAEAVGISNDTEASGRLSMEAAESPAWGSSLEQVRKALAVERVRLNTYRTRTDPCHQREIVDGINRLDDLTAAASLPGITTEDYLNYARGHKEALPPAFKSLLDFRERMAPQINSQGYETGELKNDTIEGWHGFLETYPGSPKAEAASFRMTRLIARQSRGRASITAFHFPAAPIPNGYKHLEVERGVSHNPAEVLNAITLHEERFPKGRYQDDLNLLRAGVLIDLGDFSKALALLETILANPVQRDLHVMAALEFADIAQLLLLPEERSRAAEAFRQTAGAMQRLGRLVAGDTFLSRLQPLMPWLEKR